MEDEKMAAFISTHFKAYDVWLVAIIFVHVLLHIREGLILEML